LHPGTASELASDADGSDGWGDTGLRRGDQRVLRMCSRCIDDKELPLAPERAALQRLSSAKPMKGAKIGIIGAGQSGEVTVRGENRSLEMARGAISDSFGAYETHVYEIG
jgi:hypothetical protein